MAVSTSPIATPMNTIRIRARTKQPRLSRQCLNDLTGVFLGNAGLPLAVDCVGVGLDGVWKADGETRVAFMSISSTRLGSGMLFSSSAGREPAPYLLAGVTPGGMVGVEPGTSSAFSL